MPLKEKENKFPSLSFIFFELFEPLDMAENPGVKIEAILKETFKQA